MPREMKRRTMGQDWGGRSSSNPPGTPRVSAGQVRSLALDLGIKSKRERAGWSMWMYQIPGDCWRVLGDTNYRALALLKRLQNQAPKSDLE